MDHSYNHLWYAFHLPLKFTPAWLVAFEIELHEGKCVPYYPTLPYFTFGSFLVVCEICELYILCGSNFLPRLQFLALLWIYLYLSHTII